MVPARARCSPITPTWKPKTFNRRYSTREEGLQRLPDGAVFDTAGGEGRILLTFDLDFGEIVALSGERVVSVILFRLHNTRTPHVRERLQKVLAQSARDLEFRLRVRRLPLKR